jgi:hypothetical protein
MGLMPDEIANARRVLAREAEKIVKQLMLEFQRLSADLCHGDGVALRGCPNGTAGFLFTMLPYNETDTAFADRIHRLKGLLTAIMAMQDLESKDCPTS